MRSHLRRRHQPSTQLLLHKPHRQQLDRNLLQQQLRKRHHHPNQLRNLLQHNLQPWLLSPLQQHRKLRRPSAM